MLKEWFPTYVYICLNMKHEEIMLHICLNMKHEEITNLRLYYYSKNCGKRTSLEVLRYRMQCGKPSKLFLRLAWKSNSFFSGIMRWNAQQSLVVLNERNMLNFIDVRAIAIELHYWFFKKETVNFIFIFLMQNVKTFMVIRACWKPSLHKRWEGLG